MNPWLVLVMGGLVTFATRLSFIALFGKLAVPAWLQRALRFVPPAVLSAIIAPELFLRDGQLYFSIENARLLAGMAAVIIAVWRRSTLLTILAGMILLLFFLTLGAR
jgi:branched-subunit amino acid transport protein